MQCVRNIQCDVITAIPIKGNGIAVIIDEVHREADTHIMRANGGFMSLSDFCCNSKFQ